MRVCDVRRRTVESVVIGGGMRVCDVRRRYVEVELWGGTPNNQRGTVLPHFRKSWSSSSTTDNGVERTESSTQSSWRLDNEKLVNFMLSNAVGHEKGRRARDKSS